MSTINLIKSLQRAENLPDKEFRYTTFVGFFIFRRCNMLVKQHLELDHDSKGTVHLYNTYDMSPAAEVARDCTANGGGRASKNGVEYRALGFIPQECWSFDPWLITAKRAQMAGDKAEFTKYVKKFFEVHPEYRPSIGKKYF